MVEIRKDFREALILKTLSRREGSPRTMLKWFSMELSQNANFQDIFDKFEFVWCIEGLLASHINFVVTWKVRPRMGIIS